MKYIIKISLKDEIGLIYKIAQIISKYDLNIEQSDEFVDAVSSHFFMRLLISAKNEKARIIELKNDLDSTFPNAKIQINQQNKKDIIIFATKESHCLGDILLRYDSDELEANIKAVISNYENLKSLVERFNIPYHHIPVDAKSKEAHEGEILKCLEKYANIDYIILAKYMRILTPGFVEKFENKIINIHHSFLPAFIGANPYQKAYERGVKIIGATAHFVNNNLDDGPIITQETMSVNHTFSAKDMARAGRDIEKLTLAKALNLALADRIFIHKNKTIVF